MQQDLPEFEIADDTYVETRESRSSLEREMTIKAFTASGIHAAFAKERSYPTESPWEAAFAQLRRYIPWTARQSRISKKTWRLDLLRQSRGLVSELIAVSPDKQGQKTASVNIKRVSSVEWFWRRRVVMVYWLQVQQDKPEDLLKFLTKVTTDPGLNHRVRALARHAKAQQRWNPDCLEVSVKATRRNVSSDNSFHSLTVVPVIFDYQITLSQPGVVQNLSVERTGTPGLDHETFLEDRILAVKRQDIREFLTGSTQITIPSIVFRPSGRLPKAVNLAIGMQLLPFMDWGQGAEPYLWTGEYFGQRDARYLHLEWPDIELNSRMQWKFPLTRIPQRSSRLDRQPSPILSKPFGDIDTITGDEHRLEVPQDKKSRYIFSKK
ncbi:MAG: hypothetical protein Q9218_007733 [Villophora microphyllina]